jgi:hypothetical protein
MRITGIMIALLLPGERGNPATWAGTPPGGKAVRLIFPEDHMLEKFLSDRGGYELLLSERPGKYTDFLMTEEQIRRFQDAGGDVELLGPEHYGELLGVISGRSDLYSNYTLQSMVDDLTYLAAAHPDEASLSIIGYSHEKRPIYLMKVSDHVGKREDEPRLYFQGVHHGHEAIGVDCCLALVHYLLDNYGTDPFATAYVNDFELFMVPMANPDGWDRIENWGFSWWRKNARDNDNNGIIEPHVDGVDLNRNMSFHWGLAGSTDPSDGTYMGPHALSEPENQAIAALADEQRFQFALTYHMSGDVIIYPWTHQGMPTPDHLAYSTIGGQLAANIPSMSYGHYLDEVSHYAGGFLDDHLYGWHGTFCYTVEVSSTKFPATIDKVASHNLNGVKYLLNRTREGQITGIVTNSKSGKAVSATVEINTINTSELPDRISDPDFGRYRWFLNDGIYTLRVTSTQGYESVELPGLFVHGPGPTVQDVILHPLDAWIEGYPEIGKTVELNLSGEPGKEYLQFIGFEKAEIPIPPYGGMLRIDPVGLVILSAGLLGPSGSVSESIKIPGNPGHIGMEVYYQSLKGDSLGSGRAEFTNLAWITIK